MRVCGLDCGGTFKWQMRRIRCAPCNSYAAYLYFQLGTHRDEAAPSGDAGDAGAADDSDDGEKGAEVPSLSLAGAVFMLTSITVVVASNSECAMSSTKSHHMSSTHAAGLLELL